MIHLTDQEFHEIYTFVKENYGINLIRKRTLIESRLFSVLNAKGLDNFSDYIKLLKSPYAQGEVTTLINKLTTNHTYFMRENDHFDFLQSVILPNIAKEKNRTKELRIWSAGCSSGEEVYNIVMVIKSFLGAQADTWDYRPLATDISQQVMDKAKLGLYPAEAVRDLPAAWVHSFFLPSKDRGFFQLKSEIIDQVVFKYLNLMEPFHFNRKFDVIFCRNVMIYFDSQTKMELSEKFYDVLKPGGYLLIGHSESIRSDQTKFEYIKPSIYRKGEKT